MGHLLGALPIHRHDAVETVGRGGGTRAFEVDGDDSGGLLGDELPKGAGDLRALPPVGAARRQQDGDHPARAQRRGDGFVPDVAGEQIELGQERRHAGA